MKGEGMSNHPLIRSAGEPFSKESEMPLNANAWKKVYKGKSVNCHTWDSKGNRINTKILLPDLKLTAYASTRPTIG